MNDNRRNYYVEWQNIRKSTVYALIGLPIFLLLIGGGVWWLVKNKDSIAKTEQSEIPKDAASLMSYEGEVRITRAATRETILVTKPTYVLAGDTIQTQADGRAQIRMIDGSVLTVRPDSTVVVRDSSSIFGGSNVRVALNDGQINVKTQDQADGTENVVEMRESENQIYSQTDASFDINKQTDGGEIRISRGSVATSNGGEKTVLGENEFASVNNGKITVREKLLSPPKLVSPAQNSQINAAANGTADVFFSWEKPDGAVQTYQIQISRSPFFMADSLVLMRESLNGTNFSPAGVLPGNYYWRVRAKNSSGQTGDWSEPWRYSVVKSQGAASLQVSGVQIENVGGNVYIISGKTKPGSSVRVGDREMFAVADGSFRIQFPSSDSEAVLDISDEAGNRTRFAVSLQTGRVRQI